MSKPELQVQVNIIEENESGELVITIDKKPEEYREIFFYKLGKPDDHIRFNMLQEGKNVNFTGKVIIYYPKELLHHNSDKNKKALLAKGEIIEGLKEGRWVYYHEKFDDMEQVRPNDFESNIVFYKKGILNGEINSFSKMEYHMKLALIKTVKKMVNGIAIIATQGI